MVAARFNLVPARRHPSPRFPRVIAANLPKRPLESSQVPWGAELYNTQSCSI